MWSEYRVLETAPYVAKEHPPLMPSKNSQMVCLMSATIKVSRVMTLLAGSSDTFAFLAVCFVRIVLSSESDDTL